MFSVKEEAQMLKKSTFEPQRPKTFRPHIDKWNGTLHTWLKKKMEDKKFDIFHTLTMTGEWGGYPWSSFSTLGGYTKHKKAQSQTLGYNTVVIIVKTKNLYSIFGTLE